ncbi:MAG: transcriptional repressor [Chloroflexi bacterium]|nr:transcriptional repressor [Chloroflexota bacterium]
MSKFDNLVQKLRQHGERLTIQRRLVIEALCSSDEHMTINDIQHYIRTNHLAHELSEPTVYRIVQRLKDLRLVSQTDMAGTGIVYQLIDNPPHHHLICLRCGCIIDVNDNYFDDLRQRFLHDFGFEVRIDHMAMYGVCAKCQQAVDEQA